MKTSKRLLSILLMLTMLLSMFTVMAAAADPCTHPNMEDVAYKAPTCTTDGCYAHKHCPECGKDFDKLGEPFYGTVVIEKDPDAHGNNLVPVKENPATCVAEGTQAYYHCNACSKNFSDAAGNNEITDLATVKIPATGHDKEFHAAKDATCKTEGNIPYYLCKNCNKKFVDEAMTDEVPFGAVTIICDPTNHEDLKLVEAKAATCTKDGNEAYYHCDACNKNFSDAAGRNEIRDLTSVKISATGHKLVQVEGKDATCVHKGCWAHQKCLECGQLFNKLGEPWSGTTEIEKDPTNHEKLENVEAKAPTCTETGMTAGSKCSACGVVLKKQEVIPALGHDLEHVAAKEPTKTATGNIEYWHCKRCDKYFSDADGKNEIKQADTVIPQLKEEKHTLTIAVEKVDGVVPGEVQYAGKPYEMLEGLQKGETRELTAVAKSGYQFKEWKINGASVSDLKKATTTVTMDDTDATITAEFVKKTAPVDTFKLTVEQVGDHGTFKIRKKLDNGKWGNWWTAADDGYTSTEISNLKKGTSYQIKAVPGTNYEASWKVNNKTATVDNDIYTATINKNDISVEITFTKIDTKNLKLSVDLDERHGKLKYYDDDEEKWVTYDDEYWTLSKGDKVEFKAVPDSGYKAVWQLGSGSKTSATYYDVTYRDMDGKNRTLHVDFVKKSSSDVDDYPTLTFDITGGKHGTVYRGTREYEDGDVISIKKNDKMTFKAKADKGYVAVWTYKGDTYVGDEYTVKMGANDAKLYVEFMDKDDIRLTELPFRDVSKRDWYYDDVVYVYRKGYMDGMSSTRFGGELNTTRGQIVTILWRLTGEPRATKRNPFTDVSSSQYYYDAISWAYDAGVVDGFDAHTFKPDQNVTREQLAAILYRYAKYMNLSTSGSAYLAKYTDADKIANWAYDAMAWANYRGLINGTSATRIDPKGYATRAQIAAILHRFAVEYGA